MKAIITGVFLCAFIILSYYIYTHRQQPIPIELGKTYKQIHNLYTVNYPSDWIYGSSEDEGVIFSGPKNSVTFFTLVKIEVLTPKKLGSNFVFVSDLLNDLVTQLGKRGKVLSFGDAALPSDSKHFKGMYVTIAYPYNGKSYKRTQYILADSYKKGFFYLWSYTAVEEYFDLSLPISQAMFHSWIIQNH